MGNPSARSIFGAIVLASLTLDACNGPTPPSRVWTAHVEGTVRDAGGSPVSGGKIIVESIALDQASPGTTKGRCSGYFAQIGTAVTRSDGSYSVPVQGGARPAHSCVFVSADGVVRGAPVVGAVEIDSLWFFAEDVIKADVVVR